MKAIIYHTNVAIAVVDGKYVRSINKGFVEMYIPKTETDVKMLEGLTRLALDGGTVAFEPNYESATRGECIYLAVKSELVQIKWAEGE